MREAQRETVSPETNAQLDEFNVQLQERQKLRGKTFVSRTSVVSPFKRHAGARIVALRVVIANPLTYEDDIDRVLVDQREILGEIEKGARGGVSTVSVPPTIATTTTTTTTTARLAGAAGNDEEEDEEESKKGRTELTRERGYWSDVWNSMNQEARAVFHGSKEAFIGSLISPDLKVEDGLMKDPRYEKHIKEDASYTYFS